MVSAQLQGVCLPETQRFMRFLIQTQKKERAPISNAVCLAFSATQKPIVSLMPLDMVSIHLRLFRKLYEETFRYLWSLQNDGANEIACIAMQGILYR